VTISIVRNLTPALIIHATAENARVKLANHLNCFQSRARRRFEGMAVTTLAMGN
jgi:hypothetical protein